MSANRRDKRRERYSRNTEGWNAQGFFEDVANIAEYPAGDLSNLIYTDAPGVIGMYIDGVASATAPLAGESMFFAQKNTDGTIKKSTEIIGGQYTSYQTLSDPPVKQIDTVSPLNINIVGGLQEFVLSVRETTPANQPFPVMEGRAIVRSGSPTEYQIATKIASDITNSYDFERNADNGFVAVQVTTTAVGGALTPGGTSYIFTDGSTSVFSVGAAPAAELVVGGFILATIAGVQVAYKIVDVTATTVVIDRAHSTATDGGVDSLLSAVVLASDDATIDAAVTSFVITGKDELTHFDTSVSEDLGDAVITNTTDWNFGSGASWQVASIEDECAVFDGWTTLNEAWVRDFGAPDLWVDDSSATVYNLYFIDSINRIIPSAGTPQNQTLMEAHIIVAAVPGSDLDVIMAAEFA